MQRVLASETNGTFLEINTTPLIDVLLVLLIMFIITIPIQTHAVKLDLPGAPEVVDRDINRTRNHLVITAGGQVLWNGTPTSTQGLRRKLEITQQMDPVPELHLQPEPEARYELVDEVLATTKQADVRNMGFVGNERYAAF